jgi:hypothetical protein
MKVAVDFSVFTKDEGAFGNVSGEVSVITVPQIGDSISFLFSDAKVSLDQTIGFGGILKVTDRIIAINREDQQLALALSNVVVQTKNDALKVMQYFEYAFDLFAVRYEDQ